MPLFMSKPTYLSLILCRFSHSKPNPLLSNGHFSRCSTTTGLRSFNQGRGTVRERRVWRKQVFFTCGGTLSLSGMPRSHSHCDLFRPHCQIPLLLSHSSSFHNLQEKMLVPIFRNLKLGVRLVHNYSLHGKRVDFDGYFRLFSGICSDNTDSDGEGYGSNGDGDGKSGADPKEVERICKVLDELFVLDSNMEAVLDECGISLSHDLVVDVLERFNHARKPAYRFFCWAGSKPGYAHESRTYNSMMSILGKTRQFETIVFMLDEMGEKGLFERINGEEGHRCTMKKKSRIY